MQEDKKEYQYAIQTNNGIILVTRTASVISLINIATAMLIERYVMPRYVKHKRKA